MLIKVRPDSSFVAVDVSRRKPANDAKCRGFDLTNIWNFLEAVPGVEDQRCLNKVAQYSRANRADFIGKPDWTLNNSRVQIVEILLHCLIFSKLCNRFSTVYEKNPVWVRGDARIEYGTWENGMRC